MGELHDCVRLATSTGSIRKDGGMVSAHDLPKKQTRCDVVGILLRGFGRE